MVGDKQSKRRKIALIEDLFDGELDESAALAKHGISRKLYNKWLADVQFRDLFEERIARAYRQSEIILARYAPLAAAKLVQLTESENQETARKACLDIISQEHRTQNSELRTAKDEGQETTDEPGVPQLSDEIAGRILTILAEAK
jgi:hypothetical protein